MQEIIIDKVNKHYQQVNCCSEINDYYEKNERITDILHETRYTVKLFEGNEEQRINECVKILENQGYTKSLILDTALNRLDRKAQAENVKKKRR